MIIYPIAYIVISLPIAAGRMSMMNGRHPGMPYFYSSGSLLLCSGWVDSILYFLTRRRLLEADIPTENGSDNSQKCDHSYDIPPTIGGGIRGVDHRNKPSPATLKNGRPLQTASSSTDHIIDTVELPEFGQVNQITRIEITSEPTRTTSSSSSSSSNRHPAGSLPPSATTTSTSNTSTLPPHSEKWPKKYQVPWAN